MPEFGGDVPAISQGVQPAPIPATAALPCSASSAMTVRMARTCSLTSSSPIASVDRRRAVMPKSCNDLVTYFAKYAATRRGESRDDAVAVVLAVSESVAAVVVSVSMLGRRFGPEPQCPHPLVWVIVAGGHVDADAAAAWRIRAVSSVAVIGDDQTGCGRCRDGAPYHPEGARGRH
ncbi:hypothetical protein I550_6056 [Mycobacterium intracellulare 1956]|uniref:Uncharacterized protein n=1 Tax=Mycobacterium intracellulare 1956 TaxID=1299331 RepID=X8CF23_MYCIT|nr:hypothetical protein I550_6056 [Mycobacterium intracellulare 1956]